MVLLASVHVDFHPLSGSWDGHHWDRQQARCSNNFMSGPTPPLAPPGVRALVWEVTGISDPDAVVFNVSVDLPGDDDVLFTGVRNNTETSYLPTPTKDDEKEDPPLHNGYRWDEYYHRGIYIASVEGAPAPFTVTANGIA